MSCLNHQKTTDSPLASLPYVDLQTALSENILLSQLITKLSESHQQGTEFLFFQKLPLTHQNSARWLILACLDHLHHEHLYQSQTEIAFLAQQISQNLLVSNEWLQQQIKTTELDSDLLSYFACLVLALRGDVAVEKHLGHIIESLDQDATDAGYSWRRLWFAYAEKCSELKKIKLFHRFLDYLSQNYRVFSSQKLALLTAPFLELSVEGKQEVLLDLQRRIEEKEVFSFYFERTEPFFELYLDFLAQQEEDWSPQQIAFLWDCLQNRKFNFPNNDTGQEIARQFIRRSNQFETQSIQEILEMQFGNNQLSILALEFFRQHEQPRLRQAFIGYCLGQNETISNKNWLLAKLPSLLTKLPLTDPCWQALAECYQTMISQKDSSEKTSTKKAFFQTNPTDPNDQPYVFSADADTEVRLGCLLLQKITTTNQGEVATTKGILTTEELCQRIIESMELADEAPSFTSLESPYPQLLTQNQSLQETLQKNSSQYPRTSKLLPYPVCKNYLKKLFQTGDRAEIFFASLLNQEAVQKYLMELIKTEKLYLTDDLVQMIFGISKDKKSFHNFLLNFTPRNLAEKNAWRRWCFTENIS